MKNMPVIDESRKRKAEDILQPTKKVKVEEVCLMYMGSLRVE